MHSGINSLALTETGNCHHSVPCYVLCPPLSAEGRGEKCQPSPVYCPPRHRQAAAAAQGFCTVPDHTQRNRQPNDLFARHRLGDPEGQIVEAETEAETVLAEGAALGIVVGIPEREPDDALSGGEGGGFGASRDDGPRVFEADRALPWVMGREPDVYWVLGYGRDVRAWGRPGELDELGGGGLGAFGEEEHPCG